MIYILENNYKNEFSNYLDNGNNLLITHILRICEELDKKCLLLHKYKLPKNLKIRSKYNINKIDKLIYDRLDTDIILLYHLDIFKKDFDEIHNFFNYCNNNKIDVYLSKRLGRFNRRYNLVKYMDSKDYTILKEDDLLSKSSQIKRDIKINKLFD